MLKHSLICIGFLWSLGVLAQEEDYSSEELHQDTTEVDANSNDELSDETQDQPAYQHLDPVPDEETSDEATAPNELPRGAPNKEPLEPNEEDYDEIDALEEEANSDPQNDVEPSEELEVEAEPEEIVSADEEISQHPPHADEDPSESVTNKVESSKPVKNLTEVDRNKQVQLALNARGERLGVDGILGRKSQDAIRRFQRKNRLQINGLIDEATRKKLGVN